MTESWIVASHRPAEHTRAINEHTLSLHLRGVSEAHKAGMITLFAVVCWSTAAHICAWPIASSGWPPPPLLPLPQAQFFRLCLQPLLRLLRRGHPSPILLPVAGRQASLAAVADMATLADVCPHHETERGLAARCWVAPEAKVCARGFVNKV